MKPIIHIENPDEFTEHVRNADKPCLVDFWSKRCPPCNMLAPIIGKLADEYKGKAVICKVSLDLPRNNPVAAEFNIRNIPTVILFDKGENVKTLVGLRSIKTYKQNLDKLIE